MGRRGLPLHRSPSTGPTSGPEGLVGKEDLVIIKVNGQWAERGGTNTDLLRSLIGETAGHPEGFDGEIVVADNGQRQFGTTGRGGDFDFSRNNAEDRSQSIRKVVDSFAGSRRVSARLWDGITTRRVGEYDEGDGEDGYVVAPSPSARTSALVSYPKFRTDAGTFVSFKKGLWDPKRRSYDGERLKVINLSLLKSHVVCGVTATVKNYMGVVSDKLTARLGHRAHDRIFTGAMGTQMVESRLPALNIIDAIWINPHPGRGPSTGYDDAVRTNTIAAAVDPFALDSWAAKNILMPAARKEGYRDLSSLDPECADPGSFGDWLRLSMAEFHQAGIHATMDEAQVQVFTEEMENDDARD